MYLWSNERKIIMANEKLTTPILTLKSTFNVNGSPLIAEPFKMLQTTITYDYFIIRMKGRDKELHFNTLGPQDSIERIAELNNIAILCLHMFTPEEFAGRFWNNTPIQHEKHVKMIYDFLAEVRKEFLNK